MSRIRHATETFVNHLIDSVKKLISSNTEQINVLSTNKAEKKYVDEQDLKSMNYKALIDNTRLYMTTQTGIYLTPASGVTDLPEGWAQGRHTLVCFNPNNDLYGFQLITTYAGSSGIGNNRKFAIRHAITEGSKWLELANTEKTDISFPFTGSYMSRGGYVSKVTKDAMGLVTINVTFQINDGSTLLPQGNNIIGTLPVGYRPQGIVAGVGSTAFGGNMVNVRVTVGSDGVVTCTTGNGYTGSNVIGFSISYYV